MSVLLSAPVATPKLDTVSGFALLEQPITLTATSPVLADGTPMTHQDASGTWLVDATTAKTTFSYGALLYRVKATGVEIYDGANWVAESAFDPLFSGLKPSELAFDATKNQWTGTFVLSTVSDATDAAFQSDRTTDRPAYGFLTVFRTPKQTATDASRSPRSPAPFGVISSANATNVKAGPVQALALATDPKKADGFAVFVTNAAGLPVADFLVSSNTTVPSFVMLDVYSGGVVRASLRIDGAGDVTVQSATTVAIEAPIVTVTGELRAQQIRYLPYAGGPEQYL